MSKSNNSKRNFVAAEMGNRFKSKRFDGRGNRRANDARNTQSYMNDVNLDDDNEDSSSNQLDMWDDEDFSFETTNFRFDW